MILNFPPSEDQRAQGMPGARCARSLACKSESSTHASRHGHTGNTRHSPRNGLRLISRSPRGPGSFAPVVRGSLRDFNASVGAPGPHDFAVRFKRARLTAPSASTATRLTSVTIAKRPSWRGGMICFYSCFYRVVKLISEIQKLMKIQRWGRRRKIFLRGHLDRANHR